MNLKVSLFQFIILLSIFALLIAISCSSENEDITMNNPPSIPNLLTPSNNETDVNVNTTLYWNATDPDGDKLSYSVRIDDDFGNSFKFENIATDTLHVNLEYSTKYNWSVIAKDNSGASSTSDVHTFITKDTIPPNGEWKLVYLTRTRLIIYDPDVLCSTTSGDDVVKQIGISGWLLREWESIAGPIPEYNGQYTTPGNDDVLPPCDSSAIDFGVDILNMDGEGFLNSDIHYLSADNFVITARAHEDAWPFAAGGDIIGEKSIKDDGSIDITISKRNPDKGHIFIECGPSDLNFYQQRACLDIDDQEINNFNCEQVYTIADINCDTQTITYYASDAYGDIHLDTVISFENAPSID